SAVPTGTFPLFPVSQPSDESLGYFHQSLQGQESRRFDPSPSPKVATTHSSSPIVFRATGKVGASCPPKLAFLRSLPGEMGGGLDKIGVEHCLSARDQ